MYEVGILLKLSSRLDITLQNGQRCSAFPWTLILCLRRAKCVVNGSPQCSHMCGSEGLIGRAHESCRPSHWRPLLLPEPVPWAGNTNVGPA